MHIEFVCFFVPCVIRWRTVNWLPSRRFCVSLRSSSKLDCRLSIGTSLTDDVSDDLTIDESVDMAESVMSFPLSWEQIERIWQ